MTVRLPTVALVGRPNVGKSTLFNRMVGKRAALVGDKPGVTRDRLFGEMKNDGRILRVVDTGGFDVDPADDMVAAIVKQTQLAIDEADLVVLVLDVVAGLRPADREIAKHLRRAGKKTVVVANKSDEPQHDEGVADLYGLGFDSIVPVSAEHGRGVGELCDLVCQQLDPPEEVLFDRERQQLPVDGDLDQEGTTRVEWSGGPIRVAVIGRPNAGKSSLVNKLLGEERMLATPIPGTTRDAIDAELEVDGQHFVLIDTAGIRRRRSIAEQLERFSVMIAMRSLDTADVAVILLDATTKPADQDAKVAAMAHDRGKGVIVLVNKWDLVGSTEEGTDLVADVRHRLPFLDHSPLIRVSAKTGRGIDKILPAVVAAQRERHRRVGTAELNRFFSSVVEHHSPPIRRGRRARLYYVSQPLVRPPTFVFTASRVDAIPGSYSRYLMGALRERYGFEGTPIWIKFRGRGKSAGKRKKRGWS
ncbi:MAG: ribosome biogenesis GTPase Der [Myxococcota bacterium]